MARKFTDISDEEKYTDYVKDDSVDLQGEIDKINKKFGISSEDKTLPEYKKLDEITTTKDDIEKEVRDLLDAQYGKKESTERDNAKMNKESNIQLKSTAERLSNDKITSLNNAYDNASEKLSAEALKRGLARSSIIIKSLEGVENDKVKALTETKTELENSLLKLEQESAEIENVLAKSIKELEIEKAIKQQELLTNKMAELDKKKKEVLEFNNKVESDEASNALKRKQETYDEKAKDIELKNKYGEQVNKGAMTKIEELAMDEKFAYLDSYLNKKTRTEALKELANNPLYAKVLGRYFTDIYYRQIRRAE
ncbi:MAG: hypothetical protein RR334_02115 [Clostridia bacterium]